MTFEFSETKQSENWSPPTRDEVPGPGEDIFRGISGKYIFNVADNDGKIVCAVSRLGSEVSEEKQNTPKKSVRWTFMLYT